MQFYIVRVTAPQPGQKDLVDRHYRVQAKTPDMALAAVKAWLPYPHPVHPGVMCGHMPGSTFKVTGISGQ